MDVDFKLPIEGIHYFYQIPTLFESLEDIFRDQCKQHVFVLVLHRNKDKDKVEC